MEFYAARPDVPHARQQTTAELAWGRVERRSGWAPLSRGERHGLLPRPPLHAASGRRGETCAEGSCGVRDEREAGAGSGASAAYGRRGVDAWRGKEEQEACGGVERRGAAVAAQGVPGSVMAREGWRGGGEVGTKRQPAAPPAHHPPTKRRAVSARRQFPPGCGRGAVAPLGRADGSSRFRAARADDTSNALVNAAPAPCPPLAGCGNGALPGAESISSACVSGLKEVSATDGAGPVAKGDHVPAARLLAKRRIVSARRSFPPGCGRDAVPLLAVEVRLMVESGRADDGLGVANEMVADGDCSAAEGGMDVVATPFDGGVDGTVLQDEELEEGEIPPAKVHPVAQEHLGSHVSVNVTLHQSSACGQASFVQAIGAVETFVSPSSDEKISGSRIQCGEKRLSCEVAKDFKVMDIPAWGSCHVAAQSLSEGRSQVSEIAKMDKESSDLAIRGSSKGSKMISKVMFTPRKTVRPAKLIEKSSVNTQHAHLSKNREKENEVEMHGTKKEIEDTDEFTKGLVQHALTFSEKRPMTQEKDIATVTGYFGPRKKVKVKDPANLPIKLNSKCELGSNEKLDKADSNLEDDDLLNGLAVREGKLEFYLKDSSLVRSIKCQRQYGVQTADIRSKVKMMCRRFEVICRTIAQAVDQRSLKVRRIDLAADKAMRELPDFSKPGPIVGKVPGVEIGDRFLYRVQLAIVGLHRPYQGGIDCTKDNNDNLVAISVVASGGYPDELFSLGELVYTGSGGKLAGRNAGGDQKLERGNLALKNCIKLKSPVRVIHGFKGQNNEEGSRSRAVEVTTFTYDGLYHVVDCWREGQPGSKVLKYRLQRIPGQPELPRGRKTGI